MLLAKLPEGYKRLFILVSAGYLVMALWWIDKIRVMLSMRDASNLDVDETADLPSGPPLEHLHAILSNAANNLSDIAHSQPFFVLVILTFMYVGTCGILFSMLWLMDGFRQDQSVSMGPRRN